MYLSNRYAFLYTESCIDDPEQVLSSPCVVSSVDQLACNAPATDDTSNFNDTAEVDSSSIDNLPTSESIETDTHTDFAFSSNGLHVSNLNMRHIVPKIDEIRLLLSSENSPHILGLCETFLCANNPYSQLSIDGYNFFRKDRSVTQEKYGRGLLYYFKESLNIKRRQDIEISNIETL